MREPVGPAVELGAARLPLGLSPDVPHAEQLLPVVLGPLPEHEPVLERRGDREAHVERIHRPEPVWGATPLPLHQRALWGPINLRAGLEPDGARGRRHLRLPPRGPHGEPRRRTDMGHHPAPEVDRHPHSDLAERIGTGALKPIPLGDVLELGCVPHAHALELLEVLLLPVARLAVLLGLNARRDEQPLGLVLKAGDHRARQVLAHPLARTQHKAPRVGVDLRPRPRHVGGDELVKARLPLPHRVSDPQVPRLGALRGFDLDPLDPAPAMLALRVRCRGEVAPVAAPATRQVQAPEVHAVHQTPTRTAPAGEAIEHRHPRELVAAHHRSAPRSCEVTGGPHPKRIPPRSAHRPREHKRAAPHRRVAEVSRVQHMRDRFVPDGAGLLLPRREPALVFVPLHQRGRVLPHHDAGLEVAHPVERHREEVVGRVPAPIAITSAQLGSLAERGAGRASEEEVEPVRGRRRRAPRPRVLRLWGEREAQELPVPQPGGDRRLAPLAVVHLDVALQRRREAEQAPARERLHREHWGRKEPVLVFFILVCFIPKVRRCAGDEARRHLGEEGPPTGGRAHRRAGLRQQLAPTHSGSGVRAEVGAHRVRGTPRRVERSRVCQGLQPTLLGRYAVGAQEVRPRARRRRLGSRLDARGLRSGVGGEEVLKVHGVRLHTTISSPYGNQRIQPSSTIPLTRFVETSATSTA